MKKKHPILVVIMAMSLLTASGQTINASYFNPTLGTEGRYKYIQAEGGSGNVENQTLKH